LSNLDAKLREAMRIELRRLQREVGITTVYVTHDQSEALALSDEIAVMRDGKIVQLGDPETIYNRPATRFVASFIGSTNVVEGIVRQGPDATRSGTVETGGGMLVCQFTEAAQAGQKVAVSIRPENVELAGATGPVPAEGRNVLDGRIAERVFLGEVIDYLVAVGGQELRVRSNAQNDFPVGETVRLCVRPAHCLALPDDKTASETMEAAA
jgi:iron(III) transport system ATP-binding protein